MSRSIADLPAYHCSIWKKTIRRRWRQRLIPGLVMVTWLLWLVPSLGWSEHVPQLKWMAPYRAADGASCCGITDCFKAQVTLLSPPTEAWVRVFITALEDWQHQQHWVNTVVIVPGRSIHRSEDAQAWYCSKAHFQTWNSLGEETNEVCYTTNSYDVRSECVRCIFVNVGA